MPLPSLTTKEDNMTRAYLIFEDSPTKWLRALKKHYKHVSILVPSGDVHVHIDTRSKGTEIRVVDYCEVEYMFDRTLFHDVTIVPIDITKDDKGYGWSVFTCVEQAKRILGIRAWWVLTPYQLYKHVVNERI